MSYKAESCQESLEEIALKLNVEGIINKMLQIEWECL